MIRTAQPCDGTANTLVTQLAAQLVETVADAMDQAGLALTVTNSMALTSAIGKALERVSCERERAIRQGRIERRATWVNEQCLLSAADTARRLGLTTQELEMAQSLAIIAPAEVPPGLHATSDHFTRESWQYYPCTITLTDDERARIAHETLLTRVQAAQRLGVPVLTFDHLRIEHGLTPVDETRKQSGSQLNLYRADAVDRLTAAP